MSIAYKIAEKYMKKKDMRSRYAGPEEETLAYLEKNHKYTDLPEDMYKKFSVTKYDRGGHNLFKIEPKSGSNGCAILFIHGGGGIVRPMRFHFGFAADIIEQTGAALYFPLYPLGPEANAKESLEWIEGVYADILCECVPEKITVIGDSAGAIMSAALVGRARKRPSGVVLISPAVGIDRSRPEVIAAEKRDIMLSFETVDFIMKHWGRDIPSGSVFTDASAVDYSGFPPILLFYGTNEIFYPSIGAYIEKIRRSGAALTVREGRGFFHDWAIANAYPEGRKAIREMCDFAMAHSASDRKD